MKSLYENLLNDNKIQIVNPSKPDFSLSVRDLNTSAKLLKLSEFDWSLNISYNAVLQAGRSFMFYKGFKPRGSSHHKIVFEFLLISPVDDSLSIFFENVRRKRNLATYRSSDLISKDDASEVLSKAKEFISAIKKNTKF